MGLVLFMKEGETVEVGDRRFGLDGIRHDGGFALREAGSGRVVDVPGDGSEVALAPGVTVRAGLRQQNTAVRVDFTAPREIAIIRGNATSRR